MKLSVIIPSRSIDNLRPCVAAVRECEPNAEIIVVDDLYEGTKAEEVQPGLWDINAFCRANGLGWAGGTRPFVFSRNTNIGIYSALLNRGCEGVTLLNDDAILKTPGGFTRLAELAAQHEDIGIIAPVTNVTGQPLQMPKGVGLRQVPHIAFVCVYIPRRTIERVGMLDERYCVDYGVEDRDYCEAVNRAGLKVCVYDHVFVDHSSLVSTFRGDPKTPRPFTENYKLFKQKWNIA